MSQDKTPPDACIPPVSPTPRIALVVLTWEGREDTLGCLASLQELDSGKPSIYLVDNGSSDGTVPAVAERFPGVCILVNERNQGFSRGCNRGIEQALEDGADYIAVLNNDILVEPDFLAPLLEALARDPALGAVGPKVLSPDGRIWAAGASVGFYPNLSRLRGSGSPDRGQFDAPAYVDYVPGCAILAPREVWLEVGLFDTDYFAYMEDVEWCLRVRRNGRRVLYEPRSRIYHKASGSSGGGYSPVRKYLNGCNSVRFLRKHGGPRLWASFLLIDCLLWPLIFVSGLFTGRWRGALGKARGILDGLRGDAVSPPSEG
ncbi:MAG: glycosyltransferase family 2 protein [Planctomycetota bacterium]